MALNYQQEQRTIEWYRDRLGRITGSMVGVLMKSGKKGIFSESGISYMYQLASERTMSPEISGDDEMLAFYIDQNSSTTKAMRFGTEQEGNAREAYTDVTGNAITELGLCKHPEIPYLASSPDGIVKENGKMGCVEIKCPKPATFARYVAEITDGETLKKVNSDYYYQCLCNMMVTGSEFCDFVAYCPFQDNPIKIVRIDYNASDAKELTEKVAKAEEYVNELTNKINNHG